MSTEIKENTGDQENVCVVCFKVVDLYSIGCCDHAVCFECSTRMRILCKQNECPICRRELPKVIFTKNIEPFSIMLPKFERSNLCDKKVGIIFTTHDIQKAYNQLLEHRCHLCENTERDWPFRTFQQLKDHMRREHELFFCDICSDNLKIFSFERKCYNRQELGYHRRKGDRNNTSHRGHPLCEFCDLRFMDNDELFRHLRRNHFFCHFCDADGKHQYYNSLDDIRSHFRQEHFLCEEGECRSIPLAAVFRSEIDLKAHISSEHIRNMSKSATRQARTLELEFTMAPRQRNDNRSRRPVDRNSRYDDDTTYTVEPGGEEATSRQPHVFVNPLTSEHFPALGGGATGGTSNNVSLVSKNYMKFSNAAFNSNDFPSLGGSSGRPSSAVTITANSAGPSVPNVTITRTTRNQQSVPKPKESFPALGGSSRQTPGSSTVRLSVNSTNQQQPPKVSIQVNQNSNGAITTHITTSAPSTSQSSQVFPALGKSSQNVNHQPKWVQHKPKKEEPKPVKVAACPVLETSDLSSFPSLSSKSKNDKPKKSSSVQVPVDSWVNLNSMKKGNKSGASGSERVKPVENDQGSGAANSINKSEKKNKKQLTKTSKLSADLENQLNGITFLDFREENKKPKKIKNKNAGELNENANEQKNKEKLDVNQNENKSDKNGVIKKRSELKIGTLSNTNGDFPALGSTKPPPGFGSNPNSINAVKPPPGFNSSNFPSLNCSNDLTFTTSSGQSYAISPQQGYKQPNNFQGRNQQLIKRFMEVLNDDEEMKEFKTLSDSFRKNEVTVQKYLEHCRKILGNKFCDIFPELLVLLPDVERQQELFKQMSGKEKERLALCENCRQVIMKVELSEHYNHHRLESQFPSLGSAQQISTPWRK